MAFEYIDLSVIDSLEKVFSKIRSNPELLTNLPPEYFGKRDERKAFTVENLEIVACNHLFDNCPGVFGISELEGCKIRKLFQDGAVTYDFVPDLRAAFPEFFKFPESREFLNYVNAALRSGTKS